MVIFMHRSVMDCIQRHSQKWSSFLFSMSFFFPWIPLFYKFYASLIRKNTLSTFSMIPFVSLITERLCSHQDNQNFPCITWTSWENRFLKFNFHMMIFFSEKNTNPLFIATTYDHLCTALCARPVASSLLL